MIETAVSLAPLTTLKLGGAARFFVSCSHENELLEAWDWARSKCLPFFVLGGGSNVVIADAGFPGVVARLCTRGIRRSGDLITVPAGEIWDELVQWSIQEGLAGLECLSGIPGLVGAAPMQNIGAYGQEVASTICEVKVFDTWEREKKTLHAHACQFSYRHSIFKEQKGRHLILAVTFALKSGGAATLKYPELQTAVAKENPSLAEVRAAVLSLRSKKGMVVHPGDPDSVSAGSFFMNPILSAEEFAHLKAKLGPRDAPHFAAPHGKTKVSAAWLIEQAGFSKGLQWGGVGISTKHALALVNRGGSSAELLQLAGHIVAEVKEKTGVTLVMEPEVVG